MHGKFILIFLALFFLPITGIFAQLNISGRVIDRDSRAPLAGVNIILEGSSIGTATDNSGFFRIKAENKLPCYIQLSMVGFGKRRIEIKRNQNNMEIFLETSSILSDEIIIKAKEIEVEEKTFREVVSMEMMDALAIRESASANFYEAVGNLKGVDVVMQSIQFMTVNARGFNSTTNTRLVQVVDGMDNMAPGMNFPIGNIAGLNELDVESIEFIPGPSEVRYGGNAINGVLMMTSKDPFRHQGLGLYIKPGVSDLQSGSDYPFQFSGKPQLETGMRVAKAFNDRWAFKVNAFYSKGIDWYADDTTNIRPGNIKWEPDPGHDAINKYGDEVIADLQVGSYGKNAIVSRTGYKDKDLVDNGVENIKLSGALHYKINERTTAILHGNFGSATTVYTGDNRVSLSGFKIFQAKAELKNDIFLLRGYSSFQHSGNSYDAKFLAVNLNKMAKSDEQWFHEYYHAYTGGYRKFGVVSYDHSQARKFADRHRLIPGTPEFKEAKKEIISNTDFKKGAGIYNHSGLYHLDGAADLTKFVKRMDLKIGGNFRFYDLDSRGSIFPDSTGNNITSYEWGGFIEGEKALMNEKLLVKGSVRFDKSENFKSHFSPRVSAVYHMNEHNNVRVSLLTGLRNPGVKEQFMNKDLGTARYLGGLSRIKDPYDIPGNGIYLQQVNQFTEAVNEDMSDLHYPLGKDQAMIKNLDILENGIVPEEHMQPMKPEKILAFEIGYKTKISDILFFDAVYYHSLFRDFIGIAKIVNPRTSPMSSLFAAANQVNKTAQRDLLFVSSNAQNQVGIQGVALGYKWMMPMGSILSGNVTWSDMRSGEDDPVLPGFNTPGFKSNVSLQNRRMDRMENNPGFRNIGFKVTWRYQSRFWWESAFGEGWVEPVSTFDVQFSVNMKKPKSLIKFGAANFFNNKYTYSFGGSNIGILYYVSFLVDNVFSKI